MKTGILFAVLRLIATTQAKQFDPYLSDLTHQAPRTLHHGWDNLTVETNTGTFIGMYNDTYPNVRQFLRIPFAQVCQAFHLLFSVPICCLQLAYLILLGSPPWVISVGNRLRNYRIPPKIPPASVPVRCMLPPVLYCILLSLTLVFWCTCSLSAICLLITCFLERICAT